MKITSRISTVTNCFVQAILPADLPADPALDASLLIFPGGRRECVYCGNAATDWDHLRPLVTRKAPSGFMNDVGNLVPSCGPCNHAKGGRHWRDWMNTKALGKRTDDIKHAERTKRIESFERLAPTLPHDLEPWVGAELWRAYWSRRDAIETLMREAQVVADEIRRKIADAMASAR